MNEGRKLEANITCRKMKTDGVKMKTNGQKIKTRVGSLKQMVGECKQSFGNEIKWWEKKMKSLKLMVEK